MRSRAGPCVRQRRRRWALLFGFFGFLIVAVVVAVVVTIAEKWIMWNCCDVILCYNTRSMEEEGRSASG